MKTSNPTASSSRLPRARLGAALSAAIVMVPGVALAQFAPPAPPAPAAAAAQPAPAPTAATAPAATDPATAQPEVTTQAAPAPEAPAPAPAASPTEQLIKQTVEGMKKSFEFHGYLRAGFGINGHGGKSESFGLGNTAFGYKYRLGNETDMYGEAKLVNNWLNANDDGVGFSTNVMVAFQSQGHNNFDTSGNLLIREAYAEATKVISSQPSMAFWVGQRFYDRHDVHMTDFFYMDTSGFGGGFTGLKLGGGSAKLNVALFSNSNNGVASRVGFGRPTKKHLDIRVTELPAGKGNFMIWGDVVFHTPPTDDPADPGDIDDGTVLGIAGGVQHFMPIANGFNKVMIQGAIGSALNLNSYPNEFGGSINANSDAKQVRLIEHFVVQPAPRLALGGTAVLSYYDAGNGYEANWFSAGVRPVYQFSHYMSLAAEAGLDVSNANDSDYAMLGKITVAPQIATGPGFWSRPVLRAYATLAFWDDQAKGGVGGDTYRNDTMGASFGFQAESWW